MWQVSHDHMIHMGKGRFLKLKQKQRNFVKKTVKLPTTGILMKWTAIEKLGPPIDTERVNTPLKF